MTSTNVASAIVKLIAAEALPLLLRDLTVGNLVCRDFEPVLAEPGDMVNIPIPPMGTGNVNGPVLAVGSAQIVLNRHVEATFTIPDVTRVLAVPDLLKVYVQPAVGALVQRIESDLLNLYPMFTANDPVGMHGQAITEEVIDQVETAFFIAGVPRSEQRVIVVDVATYSALRRNPKFEEFEDASSAGFKGRAIEGPIGKIKGFFIFRSRCVQKTGATAGAATHNLAFAKNAIGIATRRLPRAASGSGAISTYAELADFGIRVMMGYQPDTLAQQFTVDMLYGYGVLRAPCGVVVNS